MSEFEAEAVKPGLGDRVWAAGDAMAGNATRVAALLIPLGLAAAAATGVINGYGTNAPEIVRGIAFAVGTAAAITAVGRMAVDGVVAFKDDALDRASEFKKSLGEAKWIGGVTAAGSFATLGLVCVGAFLSAKYSQGHGVGDLMALPIHIGAGVLGLATAGMGALGVADPAWMKGSDNSEQSPAPSESFQMDRLTQRREAKAAAQAGPELSAPKLA